MSLPNMNPIVEPLKPISHDTVIQPIGTFLGGGDMHDTIKVDPLGNILDIHTTIRLPGDVSTNI